MPYVFLLFLSEQNTAPNRIDGASLERTDFKLVNPGKPTYIHALIMHMVLYSRFDLGISWFGSIGSRQIDFLRSW